MALGALAGIAVLLEKAEENNLPKDMRFGDWRKLRRRQNRKNHQLALDRPNTQIRPFYDRPAIAHFCTFFARYYIAWKVADNDNRDMKNGPKRQIPFGKEGHK